MADDIRINGNQHSWGSIVAKIDDDRYTGLTGITFADKRERVKGYGMGRHHAPRGRSHGRYTVEPVKLVGWKGSIAALCAALAARSPDGRSYGDVIFQIVVEYVEPGEIGITVEIDRCVVVGRSSDDQENPDPLKEELEIDAMLIRRNGLVLFDATEGGP